MASAGNLFLPVIFVPNPHQDIGNPTPGTNRAYLDVSDVVAAMIRDDGRQYHGPAGMVGGSACEVLSDLHTLPPIEVRLTDTYERKCSQMDCGTLNTHFAVCHATNVYLKSRLEIVCKHPCPFMVTPTRLLGRGKNWGENHSVSNPDGWLKHPYGFQWGCVMR